MDDTLHNDSSTPVYHSLAPQNVVFEQRTGYVAALVIGAITLAVAVPIALALWFAWEQLWILPVATLAWLLLVAFLFWSAHYWPPVVHRCTSWRLDETGLEIRSGVFWKRRVAVPVARVQHVDVSQGPIQRMFDLGTLTVHTAGTKNASVELAGLEHAQALQLRDRLIEQKDSLDVI